jgi:hypothetical protein
VASAPSCLPIGRTSNLQPETQDWHTVSHSTVANVGALVEHTVKVLSCGCSAPVGKDMPIQAIHSPCAWDRHCFVVWALRHGSCLRERGRGREREWVDGYFYVAPNHKILVVKNSVKSLWVWPLFWSSVATDGRRRHQAHCYSVYPLGSIVISNHPTIAWYPGWWRTTFSMALYNTDVCMKLFNVASPNFGELGRTNMQSRLLMSYIW